MTLANQIVQSNHASLTLASWSEIDGVPNLVVVGVPDERSLSKAKQKLVDAGIEYFAWIEPDGGLGFTSLITEPLDRERKQALKNYRLWRPVEFNRSAVAQSAERSEALKASERSEVRTLPAEPISIVISASSSNWSEQGNLSSLVAGSNPA